MKLGLAASAGVAATGLFGVVGRASSGRHVARTSSNFHRFIDTACRMCPAGCGIRAFLDPYDNLVTLAGIPDHPVNRGKICAKGMAAINLHYHPERLYDPLVRKGDRAEGFEGARYSYAVKRAAELIQQARSQNAVFVVDTQDDDPAFYARLLLALGADFKICSRPVAEMTLRKEIDRKVFGCANVQPDLQQAQAVCIFGANPLESGPHFIAQARDLIQARVDRSVPVFVFDPVNTKTAGWADQWLPVRPGTDGLVAQYLTKLLDNSQGVHGSLETHLEGPDKTDVEAVTGLSHDTLVEVARVLQARTNTAILAGNGVYAQPDALPIRNALAWLERRAGGKPFFAEVGDLDPDNRAETNDGIDAVYNKICTQDRPVFLLTRRTNPVYEARGRQLTAALRNTDRVAGYVSIGAFGNETNRFADVFLPERLPLEDRGLVPGAWRARSETWTVQNPIPKPSAGVKSGFDILMDVAAQIGMVGVVQSLGKNHQKRIEAKIENLKQRGGQKIGNRIVLPETPMASLSETTIDQSTNSNALTESRKKGMILIVHESSVMDDDRANCKWLSEIEHHNALRINVHDARRLGIRQGDAVRLSSERTTVQTSADVCHSVRPGVVALAKGFGHDHYGNIAAGKAWRTDDDPDAWLIWWGQYGNGVNANALSRRTPIPVKVEKV